MPSRRRDGGPGCPPAYGREGGLRRSHALVWNGVRHPAAATSPGLRWEGEQEVCPHVAPRPACGPSPGNRYLLHLCSLRPQRWTKRAPDKHVAALHGNSAARGSAYAPLGAPSRISSPPSTPGQPPRAALWQRHAGWSLALGSSAAGRLHALSPVPRRSARLWVGRPGQHAAQNAAEAVGTCPDGRGAGAGGHWTRSRQVRVCGRPPGRARRDGPRATPASPARCPRPPPAPRRFYCPHPGAPHGPASACKRLAARSRCGPCKRPWWAPPAYLLACDSARGPRRARPPRAARPCPHRLQPQLRRALAPQGALPRAARRARLGQGARPRH